MKAVVLTFLTIAIAAICGVWLLQHFYAPIDGIPLEIAKALLNILTVAVTVQVVTVVIARYNETRQRALEADRTRHRIIHTMNEAFMGVKRVRRLARAESNMRQSSEIEEVRFVSKRLYFKTLERLNDIQLKLEVLAKDVESSAQIFPQGATVFSLVSSMEEYLNQIVNEWEHHHIQFLGRTGTASIQDIPRFQDLIGQYRGSRFRTEFVHAYYAALELARSSLVITKAATWKKRVLRRPGPQQEIKTI
jgi:hypothetical protein